MAECRFVWQRALLGLLAVAACTLAAAPQTSAEETAQCLGETATIVGTSGRDNLNGTKGRDVIQVLAGNDVVHALGGDDLVCGDLGDDRLFAGAGDDMVHDEDGNDLLDGAGGDDRLFGNYGDDVMRGGSGDDELRGGNGDDEDLRPGRDRLMGGSGSDRLNAGQGDDRLDGGSGDDQLQAGFDETNDRVDGGKGADRLEGSAGPDKLSGGSGDDVIDAGGGNDKAAGGAGADEVDGGEGDDDLSGGPGADRLLGRGGDDRLKGGPGDDFLSGGEGEDTLDGGPGHNQIVDDTLGSLIAAGGRDEIRGWATSRSIATLNAEVAALSVAERDRLAEIVLDTNATGENKDKMLRAMKTVLSHSELGFYAEIWSYTLVELTGNGFFGGCNHLFLSPDAWAGLSDSDATARADARVLSLVQLRQRRTGRLPRRGVGDLGDHRRAAPTAAAGPVTRRDHLRQQALPQGLLQQPEPADHGSTESDREADRGVRMARGERSVAASVELDRAAGDMLRALLRGPRPQRRLLLGLAAKKTAGR